MSVTLPLVTGRSRPRRARGTLGPVGTAALVVVVAMVLLAALAPWLAPYPVDQQDLQHPYAGPSPEHWLGTDATGRDILSRLLWGARTSLGGPALVVALSLAVGLPIGLSAAWRGGLLDAVLARVLDVIFAVPGILVAVLAVAVFEPGLAPAVIALAVAYLPYVARTARAAARAQRHLPYVEALELQGMGGLRICARHVLPNILGVVLAQVPVAFALALVDLASLSFLGLAVQAPAADWGVLVSDNAALLQGHPEQAVYAGLAIVTTVVALTFLGDRLTEGRPAARLRREKR
ncbi:ABC transporter permease [Pimelobacter sp. 30-1]|uniref:ABC transporter permease n=1 Tax=Pimelobacter sp. 30-1 TaxID=2004991 RepID=UPI001C03E700|nr:ABC transporter permease [Pimelobacter sp. 30-1]MBU2695145.1 ABC transporter permease [Pimelobacter sp. 30-1]